MIFSPSKYVVDAILVSDFERCDSDLHSEDPDRTAKAEMKKVADEATVDKEQDPVRRWNSRGLTVLEKLDKLDVMVATL